MRPQETLRAYLRLAMTPGLGPVLIERSVAVFGSPEDVLCASPADLAQIRGVGENKARSIAAGFAQSAALADRELVAAERGGAAIHVKGQPGYPLLLSGIPSAPTILYVKGRLDAERDRFSVAVVGSRLCTAYGLEQAERFSAQLGQAGLTIVSGGARGIDTAAHRAAVRAKARTIVVAGCGLNHAYPPENAELFERIVAEDLGAVVSELPMDASPSPENFPARNRIISGLALGVLVIEAGRGSGALITARLAAEEHSREVMALPGRVDSPSSEGALELLKAGGAALVTNPADVLDLLESPARFLHAGLHEARFAPAPPTTDSAEGKLVKQRTAALASVALPGPGAVDLTETQRRIVEALAEPKSIDELARTTGLEAGRLLADTTMLEIRRVIVRNGALLVRRTPR